MRKIEGAIDAKRKISLIISLAIFACILVLDAFNFEVASAPLGLQGYVEICALVLLILFQVRKFHLASLSCTIVLQLFFVANILIQVSMDFYKYRFFDVINAYTYTSSSSIAFALIILYMIWGIYYTRALLMALPKRI